MPLEDHLGEIIRKGRVHAKISVEQAAAACGLSVSQLQQFEETGQLPAPVDFASAGRLLRLDARKLEAISSGWLPAVPDLAEWRELRQISSVGEGISVHCYLVWDEVTREGALFDTGWDAQPI